jgi:hypothetical protein
VVLADAVELDRQGRTEVRGVRRRPERRLALPWISLRPWAATRTWRARAVSLPSLSCAAVTSRLRPATFDVARNQLARTVDVMLEPPGHRFPLSECNPELTFLVHVTPELVRGGITENAISRSRLYGWLMPDYMDRGNSLLSQHLPHRDRAQLAEATCRIGCVSWKTATPSNPGPAHGSGVNPQY